MRVKDKQFINNIKNVTRPEHSYVDKKNNNNSMVALLITQRDYAMINDKNDNFALLWLQNQFSADSALNISLSFWVDMLVLALQKSYI